MAELFPIRGAIASDDATPVSRYAIRRRFGFAISNVRQQGMRGSGCARTREDTAKP
jgi:hypothetical protein